MMIDDKLQEAFYIKDLIDQRNQLVYTFSDENMDNFWTDLAEGMPDFLPTEYDPTYLQILIGLDNLLKNEDAPEESIFDIKDYITELVDTRVEETIELMKKRVDLMDKNIDDLSKKFRKDWKVGFESVLMNINNKTESINYNIDEILDKINDRGMSSLTREEKKFLNSKGRNKKDDDKNDELK